MAGRCEPRRLAESESSPQTGHAHGSFASRNATFERLWAGGERRVSRVPSDAMRAIASAQSPCMRVLLQFSVSITNMPDGVTTG
ncbi:hypothetical protein PUN4_230127 [Paraburkholderia unamae]|nr:hypothetical protein PUN4_230127 [Paraburkholderia unamae]